METTLRTTEYRGDQRKSTHILQCLLADSAISLKLSHTGGEIHRYFMQH